MAESELPTVEECLIHAAKLLRYGDTASAKDAVIHGSESGQARARMTRELADGWSRLAEDVYHVKGNR